MIKLFKSSNYIIYSVDGVEKEYAIDSDYNLKDGVFTLSQRFGRGGILKISDPTVVFNEAGDAAFTTLTMVAFFRENSGFNSASGGSGAGETSADVHGYYGLLSDFYFGGNATETNIDLADINTWVDLEINVNALGLFDNRPTAMKSAQNIGHSGNGSSSNPIIFNLEGLTTTAFANFRASMSFEPEEDEGQLESRLLFNRHSGTTPSSDFSIEEVSLSMQNGADVDYITEPMLSFFVGDTIDTNGVSDSGKCRFQIKSNVAGVVKLRGLTWYINK